MIVTQDDIDILRQGSQTIYLKVELCDSSLKILDSLTGVILTDSYSVDHTLVILQLQILLLMLVQIKKSGITKGFVFTTEYGQLSEERLFGTELARSHIRT